MLANKDQVVKGLTQGIEFLFKKNKVDYVVGAGRIESPGKVVVAARNGGGAKELATKNILIATGSDVMPLPGVTIDEERIVSSTGALDLKRVPKHLLVVGAGYIGLEMGTVWRRLGAKVTVVEFLDRVTPGMDGEVSKEFEKILKKQGMAFKLGTKVTGVDSSGDDDQGHGRARQGRRAPRPSSATPSWSRSAGGPTPRGWAWRAWASGWTIAAGSRPTATSAPASPGIWAIGDVIVGPMLAHKAEEEGSCVAEMLAGQKPHIDYDIIPGVVYTDPEVASIGKTEEQLKEAGHRLQGRQVPVHGQQPRPLGRRHRRLRQDPGRRRDRPGAGRAHHRPRGRHPDRRDRASPWSSAPAPRTSPAPATPIRRWRRRSRRRRWRPSASRSTSDGLVDAHRRRPPAPGRLILSGQRVRRRSVGRMGDRSGRLAPAGRPDGRRHAPGQRAAQLKAQGVDPGAALRDGALDDIVGTVEFLPGGVVRSTTPKDGTREDAHWQLDGDDLQITVNDAKGMEGMVGRVEGDRITMKPVIANDNEDTAFLRQRRVPGSSAVTDPALHRRQKKAALPAGRPPATAGNNGIAPPPQRPAVPKGSMGRVDFCASPLPTGELRPPAGHGQARRRIRSRVSWCRCRRTTSKRKPWNRKLSPTSGMRRAS